MIMSSTPINGACAYVWTYKVKPELRTEFADAYGPDGVWVKFFSQSPGYIRTDILADNNDPDRFSTIDYFVNAEARPALVAERAEAFAALDKRWEEATVEETFIGVFAVHSNA